MWLSLAFERVSPAITDGDMLLHREIVGRAHRPRLLKSTTTAKQRKQSPPSAFWPRSRNLASSRWGVQFPERIGVRRWLRRPAQVADPRHCAAKLRLIHRPNRWVWDQLPEELRASDRLWAAALADAAANRPDGWISGALCSDFASRLKSGLLQHRPRH